MKKKKKLSSEPLDEIRARFIQRLENGASEFDVAVELVHAILQAELGWWLNLDDTKSRNVGTLLITILRQVPPTGSALYHRVHETEH